MEPNPGLEHVNWARSMAEVVWVLFAMAGGVARYLTAYLKTGVAPKWGLLAAHALVSGFSGYVVAQVILRIEPDWAYAAAGIGGYLGTQGLDWAASVLRTRFGGDPITPTNNVSKSDGGSDE